MNIIKLPLESLVTPDGIVLQKQSDVTFEEAKRLISEATVRFVLADVGKPLWWLPEKERFAFWERDIASHFAREEKVRLDDYPDGYVYFASKWCSHDPSLMVVLLETHH